METSHDLPRDQAIVDSGWKPAEQNSSRIAMDHRTPLQVRGQRGAETRVVIGLVETRGFEPLTPCVQSRCSPTELRPPDLPYYIVSRRPALAIPAVALPIRVAVRACVE